MGRILDNVGFAEPRSYISADEVWLISSTDGVDFATAEAGDDEIP
jgi:hypothetical protein